MSLALLSLSIVCLCFVVPFSLRLATGARQIDFLRDWKPPQTSLELPEVSVIVPARNEERDIERALQSLLAQDYPRLELLVINDRSTDRTGEILNGMSAQFPQLKVVHLTELPDRWLGKNFAMFCGAGKARGDVLLFTDADVFMEPSAISRAVGYLLQERVDHLVMTPEMTMPTRLLESFVVTFMMFLAAYARMWKVRDPKSKAHLGIGAFNLVRREVYEAIGTHEKIRLRPDDDLKLGKLVKSQGYAQRVVYGNGVIAVRWYASLRELIHGLMKNSFSGVDYRISLVVLATLAMALFFVWPFLGILVATGYARGLYALSSACLLFLYADTARTSDLRWWLAPLFPFCVVLLIYIQWRAMLLTLVTGGIRWRDTHYALKDLKSNRI